MTRMQNQTSTRGEHSRRDADRQESPQKGREALRRSPTMSYLMDAMEDGKDIGHYGRLTFAMAARFFLPEAELIDLLAGQPEQDPEKAGAMLRQVQARNYNPPRRERIMEWQRQQDFPIIPNQDDPNSGNLYQELEFPNTIYDQIEEFWEERTEAQPAS